MITQISNFLHTGYRELLIFALILTILNIFFKNFGKESFIETLFYGFYEKSLFFVFFLILIVEK